MRPFYHKRPCMVEGATINALHPSTPPPVAAEYRRLAPALADRQRAASDGTLSLEVPKSDPSRFGNATMLRLNARCLIRDEAIRPQHPLAYFPSGQRATRPLLPGRQANRERSSWCRMSTFEFTREIKPPYPHTTTPPRPYTQSSAHRSRRGGRRGLPDRSPRSSAGSRVGVAAPASG